MIMNQGNPAWERLGRLLIQRRTALDPRYSNRQAFADATGLKYRLVYDIEENRRSNFGDTTLTSIEVAYKLEPGAIKRFLGGGDLGPRGTAPPPDIRPTGIQVIDEAVKKENLEPFVREIRREIADAVIEYGPGATGEQIFGAGHEADAWDSKRTTPDATVLLLALFRSFGHRNVGGESGTKTGLRLASVPAGYT